MVNVTAASRHRSTSKCVKKQFIRLNFKGIEMLYVYFEMGILSFGFNKKSRQ